MAIKHSTIKNPGDRLFANADWNTDHTGTATPADHGNEAHTPDFLSVEADPVFAASEAFNFVAGDKAKLDSALQAETDPVYTADKPNIIFDAEYDAHDHSAGDPTQVSHADLSNVSSDQHHAKQHSITSTSDHTSTATAGKVLKADANGLPIDATNTDADVADAVTKKHTQNTDTALGSGAEAADHGAAATDQIINVCYGTGAPPAANTTTEGALFVKYTA